jgi:hypothetical protein
MCIEGGGPSRASPLFSLHISATFVSPWENEKEAPAKPKKPVNRPTQEGIDIVKNGPMVSLCLTLDADMIHGFSPLLQRGFMVKAQVGCSIKTMLCEQFGVSPQYVEDRIKTIFLDGKPVDDIDAAIINDGSTLALSAAMPGLAGAILRRGGYLAPLRSQIPHREGKKAFSRREGMVVVKLFNLLMGELGPTFLKKGIFLRQEDFKSLFMGLPEGFWAGCRGVHVDGQEGDLDHLLTRLEKTDLVMLRVNWDLDEYNDDLGLQSDG